MEHSQKLLELTVLPELFAIHKASPDTALPAFLGPHRFLSVTLTSDELSIVAPEALVLDGFVREPGWRCLKVAGPLDFGEVGILAMLTAHLAAARISVFVVSTFDTDYVLVRQDGLPRAVLALEGAGHRVRSG